MNFAFNRQKVASLFAIVVLFAPYFIAVAYAPMPVMAQDSPKILIDMSHGQYSSYIYPNEDADLKANLTAMGYDVEFLWGGINATILADADALLLGGQYGPNGYTSAEITAIANWFNAGNKFLWVDGDSDFAGPNPIYNATAVLAAVGSHVYPEHASVEDPESNCAAAYRVVANETKTYPNVEIAEGVDAVLMHGPTLLYGSTSGEPYNNVVTLDTEIPNVYPVLYYSAAAIVLDSDDVEPIVHEAGDTGPFAAMTVEVNAGAAGSGVIAVAGASAYGDYKPMYADLYYGIELTGHILVLNTIEWGLEIAETGMPGLAIDPLLLIGGIAVVVVIVLVVVVMKKR